MSDRDPYPVTITLDRYGGGASGGKWLAFRLEPWALHNEDCFAGDMDALNYWDEANRQGWPIGRGDSPDAAYADLLDRLPRSALVASQPSNGAATPPEGLGGR